MKNLTIITITVFSIAATSLPVRADTMTYNGMGFYQQVKIHSPSRTQRVKAGQMNITYQGVDYKAYCVDLSSNAGNTGVTEKPVTDLHNGDIIGWLWETKADSVVDSLGAASLQVAIWEALCESDDNPFDLTAGDFYITENDNAATGGQNLLEAAPDFYTPAATTIHLYSPCKQDMLIPEPGTLVLMTLGAIGMIIRRKRC